MLKALVLAVAVLVPQHNGLVSRRIVIADGLVMPVWAPPMAVFYKTKFKTFQLHDKFMNPLGVPGGTAKDAYYESGD